MGVEGVAPKRVRFKSLAATAPHRSSSIHMVDSEGEATAGMLLLIGSGTYTERLEVREISALIEGDVEVDLTSTLRFSHDVGTSIVLLEADSQLADEVFQKLRSNSMFIPATPETAWDGIQEVEDEGDEVSATSKKPVSKKTDRTDRTEVTTIVSGQSDKGRRGEAFESIAESSSHTKPGTDTLCRHTICTIHTIHTIHTITHYTHYTHYNTLYTLYTLCTPPTSATTLYRNGRRVSDRLRVIRHRYGRLRRGAKHGIHGGECMWCRGIGTCGTRDE